MRKISPSNTNTPRSKNNLSENKTLPIVIDKGKKVSVKTAKGRKLSSTNWLRRQLNDPFVKLARYEGFRSRAAFKILEINQESEKIRLGIKQIEGDPFEFFVNKKVSDIVTAVVQNTSQNGVYVHFGKKNLSILIKKNQLAKEPENQRTSRFVKGDKLDAVITELDKEKRKVSLSIKALEEKQTKEAVKKYGSKDSGGILSDIFDFSKIKTKPKSKK